MKNKIEKLEKELAAIRGKWREVRETRLEMKNAFNEKGIEITLMRKNREYRKFIKEQRRLFVLLRQRERKLNKMRANLIEKK